LIEHFRALAEAQGAGCQTWINAALREASSVGKRKRAADRPLTKSLLRKVLGEESQAG
jgi:hypothetical protein